MTKNMGNADKTIRLLVAALVAVLYFLNQLTGTAALILGGIAVIFAITSFINFCPIYSIFGLSTRKK